MITVERSFYPVKLNITSEEDYKFFQLILNYTEHYIYERQNKYFGRGFTKEEQSFLYELKELKRKF